MTFPPRTGADTVAFADCLFLVGRAWVKRAVGDDQGAVAYLADAMVMVPDGTVEMILCLIEDRALPEPVPGAMDPGAGVLPPGRGRWARPTAVRFPSTLAAPARSPASPRG